MYTKFKCWKHLIDIFVLCCFSYNSGSRENVVTIGCMMAWLHLWGLTKLMFWRRHIPKMNQRGQILSPSLLPSSPSSSTTKTPSLSSLAITEGHKVRHKCHGMIMCLNFVCIFAFYHFKFIRVCYYSSMQTYLNIFPRFPWGVPRTLVELLFRWMIGLPLFHFCSAA